MSVFWVLKRVLCVTTIIFKLDGVGPVDNRPSTVKVHHFDERKKTFDTWHVTCDMWHVTCDIWHVTFCGGSSFSQNFSSLARLLMNFLCLPDLPEQDWSGWEVCLILGMPDFDHTAAWSIRLPPDFDLACAWSIRQPPDIRQCLIWKFGLFLQLNLYYLGKFGWHLSEKWALKKFMR